jgi:hypothetical protein
MKEYWGSEGISPRILDFGGFNPGIKSSGAHCMGSWVGSRDGLIAVMKVRSAMISPAEN